MAPGAGFSEEAEVEERIRRPEGEPACALLGRGSGEEEENFFFFFNVYKLVCFNKI